jgi:hypothetical protein
MHNADWPSERPASEQPQIHQPIWSPSSSDQTTIITYAFAALEVGSYICILSPLAADANPKAVLHVCCERRSMRVRKMAFGRSRNRKALIFTIAMQMVGRQPETAHDLQELVQSSHFRPRLCFTALCPLCPFVLNPELRRAIRRHSAALQLASRSLPFEAETWPVYSHKADVHPTICKDHYAATCLLPSSSVDAQPHSAYLDPATS